MKQFNILDGSTIKTEIKCRGCLLQKKYINMYLEPVYMSEKIFVSQDMENPIPGFFIISTKNHISSIDSIEKDTRYEIIDLIYNIRDFLRKEYSINKVIIIQEEKDIDSHFHIWILPIWEDMIDDDKDNIRICKNNINEYMKLFEFKKNSDKIIECNKKLRNFLKKS